MEEFLIIEKKRAEGPGSALMERLTPFGRRKR